MNDRDKLKKFIIEVASDAANMVDCIDEPLGLEYTITGDSMRVRIDAAFIEGNCTLHLDEQEQVCVDIYKHYHVSELKGLPESVKRAWSIGQEIYLNIINNKV